MAVTLRTRVLDALATTPTVITDALESLTSCDISAIIIAQAGTFGSLSFILYFLRSVDEFSWFIGIFEGEGCIQKRTIRTTHTLVSGERKTYESQGYYITIKMTDEDIIARCADYLGISYGPVDRAATDRLGNKPLYRVRKVGTGKGKLYKLLQEMRPFLSKRRQGQLDSALGIC